MNTLENLNKILPVSLFIVINKNRKLVLQNDTNHFFPPRNWSHRYTYQRSPRFCLSSGSLKTKYQEWEHFCNGSFHAREHISNENNNLDLCTWSRIRSLGPGGMLTSLRALKMVVNKMFISPNSSNSHTKGKTISTCLSLSKDKVLSVSKPFLKFFS